MTPSDLLVIRSSFTAAASDPQGFVTDFSRRALELDATLRRVFPSVSPEQASLVFAALATALRGLGSANDVPAAAQGLARRHALVGLQPKHYGVIGQALLDTLATRLGPAFTDSIRAAWAEAYVLFAEAMMARCYNHMDLVA